MKENRPNYKTFLNQFIHIILFSILFIFNIGLDRLYSQNWISYTDLNKISSAISDSDYLYIGSLGGIVLFDNEGIVKILDNLSGFAGVEVSELQKDNNGKS